MSRGRPGGNDLYIVGEPAREIEPVCAHYSRVAPRSTPPALSTRREQTMTSRQSTHADTPIEHSPPSTANSASGPARSHDPRQQPIQQVNARITESTKTMLEARHTHERGSGRPGRGTCSPGQRPRTGHFAEHLPPQQRARWTRTGTIGHAAHPAGTHSAPRTSLNLGGEWSR